MASRQAEVTSSIPCPAPAPANVIATPTAQDKITVSWDTDGSVATYKLEYAVAGTPTPTWSVVATVTPAPASTPTSYEVTSTSSLSLTLTCGTEYLFRVSAIGDGMAHNGITYSSFSFGDTSDPLDPSAAAKTDFFCTPQNLTITPLAERRALLSWSSVDNVTANYVIKARKFPDPTSANPPPDYADVESTSLLIHDISLDSILGADGLAEHPAYQFIVQATVDIDSGPTVSTMIFESAPIIIVDTPILSANGSSVGAAMDEGKAALKWTPIENVLFDDSDYENGFYSFRYRRFTEFPDVGGTPHTMIGWKPGQAPDPTAVPPVPAKENFAQAEIASTTDSGGRIGGVQFTLGPDNSPDNGPPDKDNGLTLYEVYAIQLTYEVDINGVTHRVFAGRDAYVWPSDRAAGNGERVATFPVKYQLANKTYYYRICENSFPQSIRVDLEAYIDHAFSQWELATDDWVSFEHDDSLNCEYYLAFLTPIRESIQQLTPDPANLPSDAVIEAHVNGLLSQYRVVGIITPARVARALAHSREEQVSEIYMIDDESLHISDALIQEISTHVGHGWCRSICTTTDVTYNDDGDQIISHDIKVRSSYFEGSPLMFPGIDKVASKDDIRFNACPWSSPSIDWKRYKGLVHEAGHALGIGDGTDGMDQDRHHPQIEDALMSYTTPDDYDCSPHPFDIMAIFALYQTIP